MGMAWDETVHYALPDTCTLILCDVLCLQLQLCKDLVRFLRAIGPGDLLESPHITMAMTPLKTPTPTSSLTMPSPLATVTNGIDTPDLDRSAVSVARDHLSSGSTSSFVSLSGDYKDASGKVIRR